MFSCEDAPNQFLQFPPSREVAQLDAVAIVDGAAHARHDITDATTSPARVIVIDRAIARLKLATPIYHQDITARARFADRLRRRNASGAGANDQDIDIQHDATVP